MTRPKASGAVGLIDATGVVTVASEERACSSEATRPAAARLEREDLPRGLYWRGDTVWMRCPITGKRRTTGFRDPLAASLRFAQLLQAAPHARRHGWAPVKLRMNLGLPVDLELDGEGFVYFIRSNAGPVKIGRSKDPQKRLGVLRSSTSEELELIACVPGAEILEQVLHERFADLRVRGEWFRHEGALRELIADLEAS